MTAPETIEQQLANALAECQRLREENRQLRQTAELVHTQQRHPPSPPTTTPCLATAAITAKSSSSEKIILFRNLFRGREDVYAVRWEGRNGKTGYSPAYRRVWGGSFQKKSDEPKEYFPLTDHVIQNHLTGKLTIGVYPLLTDETCWLLAADFDKTGWQDDVRAFLETCREWNVPTVIERSRSGRGGHVWVFFEAALSARLARKLGAAILTRTMERRHQVGLDSYDRFFPNQDTMPKGGFGNLIALPLQYLPRSNGNSVFLNADFVPYPDQWEFLSSVRRMQFAEVEAIVQVAERDGKIIGVRRSISDEDVGVDP
ncbi:MAG: restriction endonuclease subunit R, partial [Verrucomicrobiia bacterium]